MQHKKANPGGGDAGAKESLVALKVQITAPARAAQARARRRAPAAARPGHATSAAHKRADPAARPTPLAAFIARCEARALLWKTGEIDLHAAVDELQADAVRDGLVDGIGQDAVQEIMAEAFEAVR